MTEEPYRIILFSTLDTMVTAQSTLHWITPAIDSAFKVSLVGKRHDCLPCVHVLDRLFSYLESIFFALSAVQC